MNIAELRKLVVSWDQESDGTPTADAKYTSLLSSLEHSARVRFSQYKPAKNPDWNPLFMERLAMWIGNLQNKADQQLLLEFASMVTFFSEEDFDAMCLTALQREIAPWIAAELNIRLDALGVSEFRRRVKHAVYKTTWYCNITDSMDINGFYKINGISGLPPPQGFYAQTSSDFDRYNGLASVQNFLDFVSTTMTSHEPDELTRLVLLEDFVGSGSQVYVALERALTLEVPILFVPLVLCPEGARTLQSLANQSDGFLSVRPVIALKPSDLFGPKSCGENNWHAAEALAHLAIQIASNMNWAQPFGFDQSGCAVVNHTNTPDNSLPLIHKSHSQWQPLFPRVSRE